MSSALNFQSEGQSLNIGEISLSLPRGCELWEIDTSFIETQWLLLTPGKRKYHVSTKASDVLSEIIEEKKSLEQIGTSLSGRWNANVSPEDVLAIIDSAQWPKNLVKIQVPWDEPQVLEEASEERKRSHKSSDSEFFIRFSVVPAGVVHWISMRLKNLYSSQVMAMAALVIVFVQIQVFHLLSLTPSWREALKVSPAGYVAVFFIVTLCVIFHELGHATASARYGVKPGAIGFGIYFIYPALYTELGFAWLLPRMKRAVIDVGGFYFQLLATVVLFLAFILTRDNLYLLTIILNDFLILFSFIPFFKFDGYWLLSDLLGVPNLQKRSAEVLRSILPVIKSPYFTTRGGLTLPRNVALSLAVYRALFILFRVYFAYLILRHGPQTIIHAPPRIAAMFRNIFTAVSAGEYATALQQGIQAFLLAVTVIALLFIFKAYATWLWAIVKNSARLLVRKLKSERSTEVLTERSLNP